MMALWTSSISPNSLWLGKSLVSHEKLVHEKFTLWQTAGDSPLGSAAGNLPPWEVAGDPSEKPNPSIKKDSEPQLKLTR